MDDRVRKSEVRQRLAAFVRESPGVTITDLARLVGLSHSTVSYHLRILEQASEVQGRRDGRTVRYYAPGQYEDLRTRLRPLLERKRVRAIIRILEERPDAVPFHIARELEVSVPTVMWHLAKLREFGALELEKRHGQYAITLNPDLRAMVEAGAVNGDAE